MDEMDDIYINGKCIGGIEGDWNMEWIYKVLVGFLKVGKNVVVIKVFDE